MPLGLFIVVFMLLFGLVLALVGFGLRFLEQQQQNRVKDLLRGQEEAEKPVHVESSILKDSNEPASFDITTLPLYQKLETMIAQAGMDFTPAMLAGTMLVGAILGALLGTRITVPVFREFGMLIFAGFGLLIPYAYVARRRQKRLDTFEENFPEALDFLARSMKAGHAFSVSLETMAQESPEPIGMEFRRVFHEQNLGSPVDVTLLNLSRRVPLLDVEFFVAAVLMQRETGGNLAEILTKLGYLIRERFRLKGQVKAASAHGRLTATILSVMPLVTMAALTLVAPDYLASMARDEDGRFLIVLVLALQLIGYFWMKKIIKIKV